jgi:hypothetical protein
MAWKRNPPAAEGLYWASFDGRTLKTVRCELHDGEMIAIACTERPPGIPDEWLRRHAPGFEEETCVATDFYKYWLGPVDDWTMPPLPPHAM